MDRDTTTFTQMGGEGASWIGQARGLPLAIKGFGHVKTVSEKQACVRLAILLDRWPGDTLRKSPRNRDRNGSSTAMTEIAARDGSGSNASAGEGRSRRSDVSRQQILDVAAKLFRARGYTETSLRDIAKLVGMKAGSLYYHFASKEELAAEVLRIGVRKVHAAVVTAVDAQGADASLRSKLAAAMAAHLETLLDESDYTSAHIRCFPNVPETLRVQLGNDRRAYEKVWRTLLDEAAESDSLPSGMDPGAARLAILGALNWSLEWYDPAQGLPFELTRTLLAAFLR